MDFRELQMRFIGFLRERVRSGELTERGLARLTGVSQPHIHNVLKEKRLLSIETSDRILRRLRMDLLDLVRPEELAERHRRR
jgi:transcriptional regulator with XRE-family HTH domain